MTVAELADAPHCECGNWGIVLPQSPQNIFTMECYTVMDTGETVNLLPLGWLGSIPRHSTNFLYLCVGQVGGPLRSGRRQCRFESCRTDQLLDGTIETTVLTGIGDSDRVQTSRQALAG